ncbi:MAG TPA: putative 2-dehydropantoate 2-reductase [Chitinivibrionales bacterium]|nr:putative 2-dehydropantoate 2-reductase [Chitinivibrionales bacterium]
MSRTYAIIGTGAVGGFYGARLARAGYDVHFLAHSDYRHIRDHSLVIESKDGNFVLPHVNVYDDAGRMPPCDVVAVTLKTTANSILPAILPSIVKKDGLVLVMQNGFGFEEEVAAIAGPDRVLGVLCFICVTKTGPGRISHLDFGHITVAQYTKDGSQSGITTQVKAVADDFTKAGIAVETSPDLGTARWKKLVWNVPYSGLSVVLSALTDALNKNPHSRELAKSIMAEVCAAAKACGHPIEPEFIDKMVAYTDAMTPYRTSMKIDYDEKRPMEVESIFGNPLRAAKKAGVNVPLMEMLYKELKFLDEENVK